MNYLDINWYKMTRRMQGTRWTKTTLNLWGDSLMILTNQQLQLKSLLDWITVTLLTSISPLQSHLLPEEKEEVEVHAHEVLEVGEVDKA